jgi:hypothetical protein
MATQIKLNQVQQDGASTNDVITWSGSAWEPVAPISLTAVAEVPSGTVNGTNTNFSLSTTPASSAGVVVILDGIVQYNGSDYTVSGTTITFSSAPATDSTIFAYYNNSSGPSTGENNTASNVGDGAGNVFKEKSGVDLRFKTIKAGTNVTITDNTNDVTIGAINHVPRVTTVTSASAPTPNANTTDMYIITALAETATFGAPTGSPVQGQKLIVRIKDNGTSRTLNYNGVYRAVGTTLPTTTTANKVIYLGFLYNSTESA